MTVALVVLVVLMIAVTWFELRYLRRSSKARRVRAAKRPDQLSDEAHNAMVTTKAIVSTMERAGIRSEDVDGLMQEAQMALDRRNHRVAIDLTTRARERLMALKKERQAKGDLALVDNPSASEAEAEPTTKERLQKDFPPNMLQAKFSISMAESSIDAGRSAGRDVVQAQTLLADARSRFDAQDFDAALTVARNAERVASGEAANPAVPSAPPSAAEAATSVPPAGATPPTPRPIPAGSKCSSCGTPMKEGDAFCRKCGAQVVLTACPTCGAPLLGDDIFCRKCGTRLVH